MYGIIYKITNKVNGKIYIGKTIRTIEDRFISHIKGAKKRRKNGEKCTRFQNAILLYEKNNFILEQIDSADSLEELNEKERYWIDYMQSRDPNIGYNIAEGGDGGNLVGEYTWWNNGKIECYFSIEDDIPEDFIKGRLTHSIGPKGRIWINDGINQKLIQQDEFDYYVMCGWQRGMLFRGNTWHENVKKALNNLSEKSLNAMKEATRKFHKEHPHFTNSGSFKKGEVPYNKGKVYVTDGFCNKCVTKEELNDYLANNWRRGITRNSKKFCNNKQQEEEK